MFTENYEKGEVDYHTERKLINGRVVEFAVKKEVRYSIVVEKPIGEEAIVTHTGAYGRIKFLWDGEVFLSENSPRSFKKEEAIAINETQTKAVYLRDMVFNMGSQELEELHGKYFIPRTDTTLYWVPIN